MSPFDGSRTDLGTRAKATDTIIIVVGVVAGLYFGREILVPIAVAVLLSFVLGPITSALERLRVGKVAAVFFAVFFAFLILVGLGAVVGKQVGQLADNLLEYQIVITQKLEALRSSEFSKGMVEKASDALHGLDATLTKPSTQPTPQAPVVGADAERPHAPQMLPVEVHEPAPGPVQILRSILSALLPPLATAVVVIVFVIFILLQRADLRDRFIGLIGAHDLHRTTKALDDAAKRLSRYLLALTGINTVFGIAIAIGLTFVGVPNPILWGVVGAVLRYVPYIGSFIAAAFPLALAAAVDPGWSMMLETGVLFVVLETATGQVVEPHLLGHTTGMSPLAIIVAAAFWTLIWGPSGLLLSTPITACLVVLGRHVESLNFIELLLGDKPALSPVESFYQRVLAGDPDEVAFQAEALLKDMTLLDYYEDVAIPALKLAQADVARGVMDLGRQVEVYESVEQVVADLSEHEDTPTQDPRTELNAKAASDSPESSQVDERSGTVLCLGGRTPLDQAACAILAQLLERRHIQTSIAGPQALTTHGVFDLKSDAAKAICVCYLNQRSIAATSYSVRRLRRQFPKTPIAVCLWGTTDLASVAGVAGADVTIGSLQEAVDFSAKPAFSRSVSAGAA